MVYEAGQLAYFEWDGGCCEEEEEDDVSDAAEEASTPVEKPQLRSGMVKVLEVNVGVSPPAGAVPPIDDLEVLHSTSNNEHCTAGADWCVGC